MLTKKGLFVDIKDDKIFEVIYEYVDDNNINCSSFLMADLEEGGIRHVELKDLSDRYRVLTSNLMFENKILKDKYKTILRNGLYFDGMIESHMRRTTKSVLKKYNIKTTEETKIGYNT